MLLVYRATFLACYLFYFFPGPAPPPLVHNYVCTDPPAVGLVNHAHLASCRRSCRTEAGPAHVCTSSSYLVCLAKNKKCLLFVL